MFGPIRLKKDPTGLKLIIKGRTYECSYLYKERPVFEVDLQRLLNIGDLHTGQIPKDVIILSRTCVEFISLNLRFNRNDASLRADLINWPYLVESRVFIERVCNFLGDDGWNIVGKTENWFEAILEGGGHRIRHIVSGVRDAVKRVSERRGNASQIFCAKLGEMDYEHQRLRDC